MSREFFEQIEDEVRGLLGPSLRGYRAQKSGRLIKLWYRDPSVHFEVQRLSPRWSPGRGVWIEVGLHLESASADRNRELLRELEDRRHLWDESLRNAACGNSYGPRGGSWCRISELVEVEELDDPESASEAAEKLALYVRALKPAVDLVEKLRAG
ncbi:MAG: hypothetical protein M3164_00240 [Actinomycetota bacterium]|nr:hypothetical protein [Actinomycetota bacterium]